MERVIDRSELLSEPNTPPLPDIENVKSLGEIEYVRRYDASNNGDNDQHVDDEMDFCLFAPTAKEDATVSRIRVQTPPLTAGEPGFLSSRPQHHYLTQALTEDENENFRSAAMSGKYIISHAANFWPGSIYGWKVLHIPATKRQLLLLSKDTKASSRLVEDTLQAKRKRPGKTYRLKLRAKASATQAEQEATRRAAEAKDVAEREKRTRRNREKKAKKKQRDRAKKAAGDGAVDEGADQSSSE